MSPADAIKQLLARDWTEAGIAAAVRTSQPTINRIKQGAEPRYRVGAALVELAEQPAAEGKAA